MSASTFDRAGSPPLPRARRSGGLTNSTSTSASTATMMNCNHQGAPRSPATSPPTEPSASIRKVNSNVFTSMMMNTRMRASQKTQAQLLITSGSMAASLHDVVSSKTSTGDGCPRGTNRSLGWGIVNDVLPTESLRGLRVLITGSSRGIGADTAGYLAAAGAKVVINFRNKEARALKVVASIEEAGGEAI